MARTTTSGADDRTAASDDSYYRALANERRRIAIRVLDSRGSMHLDALTDLLASEDGVDADREAVRISLVHRHLPLLVEAGIVGFDDEQERVTKRRAVPELLPAFAPGPQ